MEHRGGIIRFEWRYGEKGEGDHMIKPIRKSLTEAQIAQEQYGLERRGHDAGELTEPAGGERSKVAEDYSTSGLFRDENFGRDSCGTGDARTADHSWEGGDVRPPDLYADTAESDFTVRNAGGFPGEAPVEEEGETDEDVPPSDRAPVVSQPKSPIRRRLVGR